MRGAARGLDSRPGHVCGSYKPTAATAATAAATAVAAAGVTAAAW
jgi:hypothetical protein